MGGYRLTSLEGAIAAVEPLLLETASSLGPVSATLRDLVERMEHDRSILRVERAAEIVGMSARTLERRFRDHVGVGPKWVIRRYRLIEAVERLRDAPGGSLASLSTDLGYFDQAHFARDVKALTGASPGALIERRGNRA